MEKLASLYKQIKVWAVLLRSRRRVRSRSGHDIESGRDQSRSAEPGAGVNRKAGHDASIHHIHNASDPGVATPLRSRRILPSRSQGVARAQKRGICLFSRTLLSDGHHWLSTDAKRLSTTTA
ncbi:hypothetical protein Taro_043600 [Colocasia esculenta]|uniref:Uncharacterized protein n=1 Tax=Colocasia esculenta TaxID=4460 RepID=A0A843WW70_COLES|nr:hypothetical protein [Colocasia esculenta]